MGCFDGTAGLRFELPGKVKTNMDYASEPDVVEQFEVEAYRKLMQEFLKKPNPFPGHFKGRGIVTCAGGSYLAGSWVNINVLRKLGCTLPIQLWYLGDIEIGPNVRDRKSVV